MSVSSASCPACGREDRVTGRPDESTGDVELSCGRCGRSWWRGARRCATCGGDRLTTRPQVMRRHSRGTQLSIVGWRDVLLCERCDAAVIESVGDGHTPVAEEYVSAARLDRHAPPAAVLEHAEGPAPLPTTAPSIPASPPPAPAPPPPSPPPTPPLAAPSTVRQALQQAQTELAAVGTVLDPTVVLLLGRHLGPTTRLDALERSGHDGTSVRDWVQRTWGRGARDAAARHTLTHLADHWLAQGWTVTDLAAGVRPQEDA